MKLVPRYSNKTSLAHFCLSKRIFLIACTCGFLKFSDEIDYLSTINFYDLFYEQFERTIYKLNLPRGV